MRIFEMHDRGASNREIGSNLGRSHTAVGEVLREQRCYKRVKRWERLTAEERTRFVMEIREKRRKQKRERGWLKSEAIRGHVLNCLCSSDKRWTPEMIAETLGDYFPGQSISAKAIYNFTKSRPDYKAYLREQGRPRRQNVSNRRCRFQQGVPPKRSIEHRGEITGDIGHFEADTVFSCRGSKAAVLTIRERALRKAWYFPIANLEADTVSPELMVFFQQLRRSGVTLKSLTLDNGGEWSEAYHKLEKVIPGFKVYFCHPYQAYQRGAVENANKQLRVFFPKGTDFAQVSFQTLKDTERIINNWPMRVLGWKSPAQVWEQQSRCAL